MDTMSIRTIIKTSAKSVGTKSLALGLCAAASIPALMIGAASTATAADLSYKDDRPAIMSYGGSWTGLYFGMQAGGVVNGGNNAQGQSSGSIAGDGGGGGGASGLGNFGGIGGNGGNAFSVFSDADKGDSLVGLHVGYNWQNANLVYGVEADIDANNSLDNLLGSVRGRLGYATDRSLFYLTAGLAYMSAEGSSSIFAVGDGGAGGTGGDGSAAPGGGPVPAPGTGVTPGIRSALGNSQSDMGFVAGAGVEYKVTNQIGVGLEGLYYTFDDTTGGLGEDGDFFTIRARLTMHLDRDSGGSTKDGHGGSSTANWNGLYLGGHVGALLGSGDGISSADSNNGGNGQNGGNATGVDAGGGGGGGGGGGTAVANFGSDATVLGGVHVGYNFQRNNWVYGVEGDASFSDSDKYAYLASARARLGYATGSYLFYGTAGVAFAGIDRVSGIFANDGSNGGDGGDFGTPSVGAGAIGGAGGTAGVLTSEDDEVGFVLGAGVDAKLTDRITVGFEGLYYGFDESTASVKAGGTTQSVDDDNDTFVLRSRISYSLSPMYEPLK